MEHRRKTAVLAHRGFWRGHPQNSLDSFRAAFDHGFGIELDIWPTKKNLAVVAHDKPKILKGLPLLSDVFDLMQANNYWAPVAIHLKEWETPGVEGIVLKNIPKEYFPCAFIFDMPLTLCYRFKDFCPALRVGVSVGDKKYHPYFYRLEEIEGKAIDIVWADEYRQLYTKDFIQEAKKFGKEIHAISPDLAAFWGHPRSLRGYQQTWRDLLEWGVDGICTDKPEELQKMLEGGVV